MAYYITALEASQILDIGYRTILRWIADGRFGKVMQTPTNRYRISWSNIEYFCKNSNFPLPDKIPKPKSTKKLDLIPIDSQEGQALLNE